MIVLALDTAGADCSAALFSSSEGRVLSCVTETLGKGHAERLMDILDRALAEAGLELSAVERIAVSVGPGSFTGIRVGVAAARGLGLALGVEVRGISTLSVLAEEARKAGKAGDFVVAIDARRDEVYFQHFPHGEPLLLSVSEARERVKGLDVDVIGSARPLLVDGAVSEGPDRYPAGIIAQLAVSGDNLPPKPLYLRGADAKPQMGFAVTRL